MTNTRAWNYAVGMIKVDGPEPTPEFTEYIEKEKGGEVTINPLPGDYNYAHLPLRQLHSELLTHTQGRPLRGSVFVCLKLGNPPVTP